MICQPSAASIERTMSPFAEFATELAMTRSSAVR